MIGMSSQLEPAQVALVRIAVSQPVRWVRAKVCTFRIEAGDAFPGGHVLDESAERPGEQAGEDDRAGQGEPGSGAGIEPAAEPRNLGGVATRHPSRAAGARHPITDLIDLAGTMPDRPYHASGEEAEHDHREQGQSDPAGPMFGALPGGASEVPEEDHPGCP